MCVTEHCMRVCVCLMLPHPAGSHADVSAVTSFSLHFFLSATFAIVLLIRVRILGRSAAAEFLEMFF